MGSTKLAVGLAHLIKSFKPGGLRRISVFFVLLLFHKKTGFILKKKKTGCGPGLIVMTYGPEFSFNGRDQNVGKSNQ